MTEKMMDLKARPLGDVLVEIHGERAKDLFAFVVDGCPGAFAPGWVAEGFAQIERALGR